jgi:hypothetical protein
LTQANILTAAELKVACEDARTQMLEGSGDVDALVRLENLSCRAEKRLGLKAVTKPPGPTLAEHIAQRAAARAGTASGGMSGALTIGGLQDPSLQRGSA